jgi:hypothetical protein
MSRRRSRMVVLALVALVGLCGSIGYVRLRMPKYQFAAPHQGYLRSSVAEYDLLVPAHSRWLSRAIDYIAPSVQASLPPVCNGWEPKPLSPCGTNGCTNYICKYTNGRNARCQVVNPLPPCGGCLAAGWVSCRG